MCELTLYADDQDQFAMETFRIFQKLVARQEAAIQDQQFMVSFLCVLVVLLFIFTLCTHIYYWRK